MAFHRLKHSFSSGEISHLMDARLDFSRFNNGCRKLQNMVCKTQGPASRREGFQFIYDLTSIGLDIANPEVRQIPFVFSELQSYSMVFFRHTDGNPRVVFADQEGLLVYSDTPPEICPPIPIETYIWETAWAGDYDINFVLSDITDIKVVHIAPDTTETVLIPTTDYTLTINPELPNTLTIIGGVPSEDGTIEVYKNLLGVSPGDIVALTLPATWDVKGFDYAQSGDEMYFAQTGLQPHIIKRFGPECWELVAVTFTDQPESWDDISGWPERVVFHQQRLAYAANNLNRQTVWMSKAGDFNDFGVSGTVVDSDAITFTLDSGTQNKIIWMISSKAFNIGTIGNEWTVTGSNRTALTPSNILAQRQTNHGGEANKPLMVGITTLFVEKYGRSVNEFVYDFNVDSYKTSDMAILSNHLTDNFSIIDWAYQQTPDSVIWSIREDGVLLGITYQRQHEVIGWHVHQTDGLFLSVSSNPGDSREDEVWVIIKRVIDGADKYYLEKMASQFLSEDTIDGRFLDSFLVYSGVAVNTLSGLDHLEGKTVDVLANGTAHPSKTVVGGEITLNNEYTDVVVGLGYVSEIWPHVPDLPTGDGTAYGRTQRVTNVDIDFYKTLGIFIGRWDSEDGEHEEEHPFRVPGDLTGQAVPLFTGIKHIAFPEGFDRETAYFIRQKQPLPLTVRAVVDTIEVYE